MQLDIIYEDEFLLAVNKPAGIISENGAALSAPRLLEKDGRRVFVIHRLDKETRGVLVFAKTQEAAAFLSESIRKGDFKKSYLAVVCAEPEKKNGTLEDLLFFDRGRCKSFVVNRERKGVKKAVLDYSLLKSIDYCGGRLSEIRIRLHTGRTHQIRAQFSSRGMPVLGDRRYGGLRSENGMALLCEEIAFSHPVTGEMIKISAPPPNDFPWVLF